MPLIGTLTSGVSALRSFTKGLEVIGNNISNVNTTGYKSSQASFADTFSNTLQGSVQVGTGVGISGISSRFTQGSLQTTGVGTDLGISGTGFFIVQDASGARFATRDGQFHFNAASELVNSQGLKVQGVTTAGGTDIKLATPPTNTQLASVTITPQGVVKETYSDGTQANTGNVLVQTFKDTGQLKKEGNNLFTYLTSNIVSGTDTLTVANNQPGLVGLGKIQSGTLELSNVDLTEEFANMITAQRSFQASSRLITVSDSVLEDIVNLKR